MWPGEGVGRQRNGVAKGRRRPWPVDALSIATDRQLRRAVFVTVLRAHPEALTFGQLAGELFAGPHDFLAGYALAYAVRELVMDGMLQSDGLHVAPTNSALFFAGLETEL
jgi:hypothetical protein